MSNDQQKQVILFIQGPFSVREMYLLKFISEGKYYLVFVKVYFARRSLVRFVAVLPLCVERIECAVLLGKLIGHVQVEVRGSVT